MDLITRQDDPNAIRISSAPNPFATATADFWVQEGMTITEMLAVVQPNPVLMQHAYVFIDDWRIPRANWATVRPKHGHLVTVRIVPHGGGGGGKNPLRVLLSIATLGAASFFGPLLGSALFGGVLPAGLATALGSAIVIVGGTMLTNAIAPIRPTALPNTSREAESPSYFIDQARNTARPYGTIPVVLGRRRVVPPLAAVPYTEVLGDANFLTMIVCWGYGPLRVSDVRIGDTAIGNFDDVTVQTREGRHLDPDITLYPDDVDQQNLNVSLTQNNWHTRTTADDADRISIDILLPRGLAAFNDQGQRTSKTVQFQIQFRRTGTAGWSTPAFRHRTSGSVAGGIITLSGARTQVIRHGFEWSTGSRDQYDVRVRRVSADDTVDSEGRTREFSLLTWSALRSFTDRDPVSFPDDLALTAVRIRASDQLSGAVDQLNALIESQCLDWNRASRSWELAYTRNPASLFRFVLQHPGRRVPAPDSAIDLDTLADWHEFCDFNDYMFDTVIDTRGSVFDRLSDICAVAKASPTFIDGRWSVIWDSGTQQVVQHLTPRNSRGFSMRRSFSNIPHGIKLVFDNEEEGYRKDERIIYADGYDDTNATNVPTLEPTGIVNADHAWRFARFHLAQTLLRRETWSVQVSLEYLVARRGRRVTVQHDVLAVGIGSARVVNVETDDDGAVVTVHLDAEIHLPDPGIDYGIKIRTKDNADIVRTIVQAGGPDTERISTVDLTVPVNETIPVGALVSIGQIGAVTVDGLVTGITPGRDLQASVRMVPYQPGVYAAETGVIPGFNSGIVDSFASIPQAVIVSVSSDAEAVRVFGFGIETGILVGVRTVPHVNAQLEFQIRENGVDEPYRPAGLRLLSREGGLIINVDDGVSYDFRVRWIDRVLGRVGAWAEHLNHTVGDIQVPSGLLASERVYASTATDTLQDNQLPLNSWGFRQPQTLNGVEWQLNRAGVSEDRPFGWIAERNYFRGLEVGAAVDDAWSTPVVIDRLGIQGMDGPRGASSYIVDLTETERMTLAALAAGDALPAAFVTAANDATNDDNVNNDRVTFRRVADEFAETWIWAAASDQWVRSSGTIGANDILTDSLSAITATIGTFRSAESGERVEITDSHIRVYDSGNILRIEIGELMTT